MAKSQPFLGVGFNENGDLQMHADDEEDGPDAFADSAFADFFDQVIIPAQKERRRLDPRISVSKLNASDVIRQCGMQVNKRKA